MEDKEGILRRLTLGEIRLARNIFGNSIQYLLLKTYGPETLRGAIGLYAGFSGKVDAGTLSLFRKILPPEIDQE